MGSKVGRKSCVNPPSRVRRDTHPALGMLILGSSACLAGWPDHPRWQLTKSGSRPSAPTRPARATEAGFSCLSCTVSFARTDALPERGGNPFLIGTCKPQGSRGRTLPSAPRSWPLDASHPRPGACVFRPRRSPGRSEVPARELQRHACGDARARCGSSEARQSGCRSLGSGRDPAGPSWLAQGEDERRARRPDPRTGAHHRAGGQPSIRHRPGARGGLVRGGP